MNLDKKIIALFLQDSNLFGQSLKDVPSDYFNDPYCKIHKLLFTYYNKHHKLPSIETIEQQIFKQKDKILKDISDPEDFILGLTTETARVDKQDYEFLIDEIKRRKAYSEIEKILPKAIKAAKDGDVEQAAELLVGVGNTMKTTISSDALLRSSNHDYLDTILEQYQKTKQSPDVAWGYKTGFHQLDKATFGVSPGEMFVVSARPGCGKSMWLLSAAINMFKAGHNIVYVSIEMPQKQMWTRAIACYSGLEINKITLGSFSEQEEEQFKAALHQFQNSSNRFEIIDAPNVTVPTIASELEQMVEKYKPEILVVDYLGIVKASQSGLQDNLAQASVVEELRKLARQKNLALLSAVQLNRDPNKGKNKVKGTERLARSDIVGSTVDCAIMIEEFDADDEMVKLSDKIKIHVIKNRKGPFPFSFEVRKSFHTAQFIDWDINGWS